MKGGQGQHSSQITGSDPQLAMFTFEKPRTADSWASARPEQQPFAVERIRKVLVRLLDEQRDPTATIDKIPSSCCRKNIYQLVNDQNAKLQKNNKKLKWNIAAVSTIFDHDRGFMGMPTRHILKRVKVILETGPSDFQEPQQGKQGDQNGGSPNTNTPKQPNPVPPYPVSPNQPTMNGGPQPPPPPHPGMDPPPPPPPMSHGPHIQHPPQPPPLPQKPQPQPSGPVPGVPGAFPTDGLRPGGVPFFDEEDPRILRAHKVRRGGKQVFSSSSSSTSSTDGDDWESDSASSSPDHVRVRNIEGDYGYIAGHRRGRKHDKSHRDKAHRKAKLYHQSRIRSHSRNRAKALRKRRDSGLIGSPNISRRNSFSSKESSPRLAHAQPNIHIHIDPTKAVEGRVRDNDEVRERRAGHNSSPAGPHKDRRRNEKINSAHAMSRENSLDGGSGTDSHATSSAHTGFDSVFDHPERRPPAPQRRNHQKTYPHPPGGLNNPHPSKIYDDVDGRPSPRYQHADDYPYDSTTRRDPYSKEPNNYGRPDLPHRRYTTGGPFNTNPFTTPPLRTPTFPPTPHDSTFPFHQKRPSAEREQQDADFRRHYADFLAQKKDSRTRDARKRYNDHDDMRERDREYAEFLDWKENRGLRRGPHSPHPLKRPGTMRHDSPSYDDDDDDDDDEFERRFAALRRGFYGPF
ncbi:hypothetical protein J1614_003221 [Plenodomus biglobosus]|nr:hypothetical protein J1614_003221 [Plenodomus biglobosus]